MSAEMFSALVTARLRPIPDVELQGGKGLELKLRVRGQETTALLERYYQRYRDHPETLKPVVDEVVQALVSGASDTPAYGAEFASAAPLLYPRLMTSQEWMDKRDAGLRLVIRPVVQELGVALVLDRGAEWEYVQIDAIPAWGVESQTAYQAALENLARTAIDAPVTVSGEGVEMLLVDAERDGYAAARALLPFRLQAWQAQVEGDLVLAMPTRDLLLGFSRRHPAFDELQAEVANDARTSPDGLFDTLLWVNDGALEPFI